MKRNRDDVPIRNYQETDGNRLAQFEVNNISRFDVNFPVFQRPKVETKQPNSGHV